MTHHQLYYNNLSCYPKEQISAGDGTNFPKPGDKLTMHCEYVSQNFETHISFLHLSVRLTVPNFILCPMADNRSWHTGIGRKI